MTTSPQVDTSQLGVAFLATQASANALVTIALVALQRVYRRSFLVHWGVSWAALTLFCVGTALAPGFASLPSAPLGRLALAAATLTAGYVQIGGLLAGAWLLVAGDERGRWLRPRLFLVPVALGLGSVLATLEAPVAVRLFVCVTLHGLISGLAFLGAAVAIARVARRDSTLSRWFVVVLFALLSTMQLRLVLDRLLHPAGGFLDPVAGLFVPYFLGLFLQLLLIASLLLWFFEDERRNLVRTAGLLSTSEELRRRSEHMEAVGRLAGGVAHDFNNLLTAITGHAELLLGRAREGHPDREELLPIARAADRAAELVRGLLTFSRRMPTRPRRFEFDAMLASWHKMLERLAGESVRVELELGAPAAILEADPGELELALINLTSNARDAIAGEGRLSIRTSVESLEEGNRVLLAPGRYLRLVFSDSGCGIRPDQLDQIFEPFFTSKPGKGTGLGLASVYGTVKQCRGEIQVESRLGVGTVFSLWLPLSQGMAEFGRELRPAVFAVGGAEAILLIEDDAAVRLLTQRQLAMAGYRVLTADNADQADQILRSGSERFDLVLSDVVMPGRSLREFVNELRARHPELGIMFMSGYSGDSIQQRGIDLSCAHFLSKPFRGEDLLRTVRAALDDPRRRQVAMRPGGRR